MQGHYILKQYHYPSDSFILIIIKKRINSPSYYGDVRDLQQRPRKLVSKWWGAPFGTWPWVVIGPGYISAPAHELQLMRSPEQSILKKDFYVSQI